MTPTIISYSKFLTKPWWCMALRAPPAVGMSLVSLPQWRCAFMAALPEGCIARLWQASATAPHAAVSSSAAPYSVFTPLLLSTLDSCYSPVVAARRGCNYRSGGWTPPSSSTVVSNNLKTTTSLLKMLAVIVRQGSNAAERGPL